MYNRVSFQSNVQTAKNSLTHLDRLVFSILFFMPRVYYFDNVYEVCGWGGGYKLSHNCIPVTLYVYVEKLLP